MSKQAPPQTLQARYEAAAAAIKNGEARELGRTAMARRYKAFFAIEDAAKAAGAL